MASQPSPVAYFPVTRLGRIFGRKARQQGPPQGRSGNLQQVTVKIDGMHCSGCASSIEHSLKQLKGVVKVNIDFPAARGTVLYDASQVSTDQIVNNPVFRSPSQFTAQVIR